MSEAAVTAHSGTGAQLFHVKTAEAPREFHGWKIADASTRYDSSVRWTELLLYKTLDLRYVLAVSGCSVVYHRNDSRCNRGVPKTVQQMDEHADAMDHDLSRCRECRPGDYLNAPDDEIFNMEISLPEVSVHNTPLQVVAKLRDPGGILSIPAKRLLETAKQNDSDFRNALSRAQFL